MMISNEPRANSEISGAPALAERQQNSSGQWSGPTESKSLVSENESAKTVAWLLSQSLPQAATAAMCRLLISSFSVSATVRMEGRYPEGQRPYHVPVGCELSLAPGCNLDGAKEAAARCLSPASDMQISAWLVRLQAGTARRQGSEASGAATMAVYLDELRKFPADVAKYACDQFLRAQGPGPVWFPTIGEMIVFCEGCVAERQFIVDAILRGRIRAPYKRPDPIPVDEEAIAADKEKVKTMLADYKAKMAERAARKPKRPEGPYIGGTPDEHGITPQMRELLARRAHDDA